MRGRSSSPPWLRAAGLVLAGVLAACSADAVDEPEPALETPGAFIARLEEGGQYRLYRTLYALNLNGRDQIVLFLTLYKPSIRSPEDAKELARGPEPPMEVSVLSLLESDFVLTPLQVVWFRTLNAEERDRVL